MTFRTLQILLAFLFIARGLAELPEKNGEAFVYVEPRQIRSELVLRLAELPSFRDVTVLQDPTEIMHQLRETWDRALVMEVGNSALLLQVTHVSFIRFDTESDKIVADERLQIPVEEAVVALSFRVAQESVPKQLRVSWQPPLDIGDLPLHLVNAADQRETKVLTQSAPSANFTIPEIRQTERLPLPTLRLQKSGINLGWFILFAALVLVYGFWPNRPKKQKLVSAIFAVLIFAGGWFLGSQGSVVPDQAALNDKQLRAISKAILHNIYRSFEYHDESDVYDNLADSVEGPLLERVYLEIHDSLQLEGANGPRVRIGNIDLRSANLEEWTDANQFRADVNWVAIGSVAHWGHQHSRVVQYRAEMQFALTDSREIKLIGIEIGEKDWSQKR